MNEDLKKFYDRWMHKTNEYDTQELSDCFDKFVSLYISYNALYGNIARENGHLNRNGRPNDYEMATSTIKRYFPFRDFCNNKNVSSAIEKLCKIVEKGNFYIRHPVVDRELIRKSRSTDHKEKTKGILEFVYFIRCNLFHGEKSFTKRQKQVLLPCITILEELNKAVYESLRGK